MAELTNEGRVLAVVRRPPGADVIASVPLGGGDVLRVSLVGDGGRAVVDLRVYQPFTPAKVLMPTKAGLRVAAGVLPELISGLQAALGMCDLAIEGRSN